MLVMTFAILLCSLSVPVFAHQHDDDATVETDDDPNLDSTQENESKGPNLEKLKRNVDGFLKPYIDNLKNVKPPSSLLLFKNN